MTSAVVDVWPRAADRILANVPPHNAGTFVSPRGTLVVGPTGGGAPVAKPQRHGHLWSYTDSSRNERERSVRRLAKMCLHFQSVPGMN